jgi:hypothetical protein
MATPAQQLNAFLKKYSPAIAAQARACLTKMRKLTPGAIEMVYDNYNWLVIGFSPTERPSDAVFSIVLPPNHVTLCFLQGAEVPDPHKLLSGSGRVVRHLRLESPKTLDQPAVRELISAAHAFAKVPFDPNQKRRLIIRSVAKIQRPRRSTPTPIATKSAPRRRQEPVRKEARHGRS